MHSKKHGNVSRAKSTISKSSPLTNGVKERSAAHDAWLEAKAKSQALRGKRPGNAVHNGNAVDVYDDFEGAHTQQSPLKKKEVTLASTPVKKQLDPLRNQKSSASTTASPSKGATLGFFKQFHQPKPQTTNTVTKPAVRAESLVNGIGSHPDEEIEHDADAGAEEVSESSEDDGESVPQSPIRSAGKGTWKGWAYGEKPKKTFEDEIRELESSARLEAENDGEDGAGNPAHKRRNRISTSVQVQDVPEPKTKRKTTPVPKTAHTKPIEERKSVPSCDLEAIVQRNHDTGDPMEIDESYTNGEPDTNASLPEPVKLHGTEASKPMPQQRSKNLTHSSNTTFSAEHLQIVQTVLLEKLTCKRRSSLTSLDNEYTKVSHLITQTVTAGESNSMLLIGARGSGKSALVNQILDEQTKRHPDDFHVVKLNGFIHIDDKIALREIWRQLGREMELDEEESISKNYADTLTTLLALLSHPAELGREQADQMTKSVIFILDEFELFASHPRQTLLYNLFDIAQSRKAPIAVLGLTTRIDVAESLEKRVKSRFSHRYVHLGQAKSFATFQEACKAAIALGQNELTSEEREQLGASNEVTRKLEKVSKKQSSSAMAEWNAFVEELFMHEVFVNHLRRIYYTTKSIPDFNASMLLSITTLPVSSATSDTELVEHFTNTIAGSSLSPPDSKLTILSSLSTLQLALLTCAARLTAIHNSDVVPFAQAYEEYKVIASKAKLQTSASGALAQGAGSRIWSKDVAKGAWEDLVECELVMEDGNRGGRVDVGLEEIGMSGVELGSWGRWCKEI